MNWTRITFFAVCPSLLAMAGGVVADNVLTKLGAGQFGIYAFAAGTVLSVILAVVVILRLRSWETGNGEYCERCSGPLGWITWQGRRYYGRDLPDFHKCWNCGKANGIH